MIIMIIRVALQRQGFVFPWRNSTSLLGAKMMMMIIMTMIMTMPVMMTTMMAMMTITWWWSDNDVDDGAGDSDDDDNLTMTWRWWWHDNGVTTMTMMEMVVMMMVMMMMMTVTIRYTSHPPSPLPPSSLPTSPCPTLRWKQNHDYVYEKVSKHHRALHWGISSMTMMLMMTMIISKESKHQHALRWGENNQNHYQHDDGLNDDSIYAYQKQLCIKYTSYNAYLVIKIILIMVIVVTSIILDGEKAPWQACPPLPPLEGMFFLLSFYLLILLSLDLFIFYRFNKDFDWSYFFPLCVSLLCDHSTSYQNWTVMKITRLFLINHPNQQWRNLIQWSMKLLQTNWISLIFQGGGIAQLPRPGGCLKKSWWRWWCWWCW